MEAASGLPALEAGLLGFCASRAAVLHLISIADSLEALLAQVGTPGLKGLSSGYSSVVSGLPPPRACWPKVGAACWVGGGVPACWHDGHQVRGRLLSACAASGASPPPSS